MWVRYLLEPPDWAVKEIYTCIGTLLVNAVRFRYRQKIQVWAGQGRQQPIRHAACGFDSRSVHQILGDYMLNFGAPKNTRIAPSPTGDAHLGLVRTAYLNYLTARATGGKFIIRIDDTDETRNDDKYTDDILKTFDWLGLDNDGVVFTSSRYDRHRAVADLLMDAGKAVLRDDAVYLNVTDNDIPDSWNDLIIGSVNMNKNNVNAIKNLVLIRANGIPTYHFASCIDDVDMGIDLIIRGGDHIDNAAKHSVLFKLLNATIDFAHVGLVFHNGKKLSKRDNLSDMKYYKDRYLASTILNGVLKLGWSHKDGTIDKKFPLIDKATALDIFKGGHLKNSKSNLDLAKLDWLNMRYIRESSNGRT
jgi:glutamyl/glutaminyl-tRNA synthetase